MSDSAIFNEASTSHIPAIRTLQRLGWSYLPPAEAKRLRGGRAREVVLRDVLAEQLRRLNSIEYKSRTHQFSEANIAAAVAAVADPKDTTVLQANSAVYDILCYGKSFKQLVGGDSKSFTMRYVDWERPEANVYHVTSEYAVAKTASADVLEPDIVLFVNGIPFVIIECKRPDDKDALKAAIADHLFKQREDQAPSLYACAQLLLALTKNEARYGCTGTPAKFWSVWKEKDVPQDRLDESLRVLINTPLPFAEREALFEKPYTHWRPYIEQWEAEECAPTAQDAALWSLCRPARLLELVYHCTVFDAGQRKVARYQQFFALRRMMERIRAVRPDGTRPGGVVWHTQGSGKSLSMVMLARRIALAPDIGDYRIVLVTDRTDLDDQIYGTFRSCGLHLEQADSGRDLAKKLEQGGKPIVTTVLHKFEDAATKAKLKLDAANIFVLVDEAHRSNFRKLHAWMRAALPRACFIGFTGTPVHKKDGSVVRQFGGIIDSYTIKDAVADQAVVPLLYEGRHVNLAPSETPLDQAFELITRGLTQEQRADLKRKFASAGHIPRIGNFINQVALDVSLHFEQNWQGTGFKAQLVAPSKAAAIRYKQALDSYGLVNSEVLISGPQTRAEERSDEPEGDGAEDATLVHEFWRRRMERYRTEEAYNKQVINAFKSGEELEILIVVHKLLTGFDEPRNTVLYLARPLRDHTLLQAIARVNRLHEGKEYGYILDYVGVLDHLAKAMEEFAAENYDPEQLQGIVTNVSEMIERLPGLHAALLDVFKAVSNRRDEEAYERHLADVEERQRFYERLSAFARCVGLSFSSATFLEQTDAALQERYRRDLLFFERLRRAVRLRYAEAVDYGEYEARIQKIVNTHVGVVDVELITEPVNIFDQERFAREVERVHGDGAKADAIAHRTMLTITEKMEEDPAFYRKFSELLKSAIDAFRQGRISAQEYFVRATESMIAVRDRIADGIPERLRAEDDARAYYGRIHELVRQHLEASSPQEPAAKVEAFCVEAALNVHAIVQELNVVNWTSNEDVKNSMLQHMDDWFFDAVDGGEGLALPPAVIDAILDACMRIAIQRSTK